MTSYSPVNHPGPTTRPPVPAKSYFNMDDAVIEVKFRSQQLLEALSAQNLNVQWNHYTCRKDTMASIELAEHLIGAVERLDNKSKEQVIVLFETIRHEADFNRSICGAVERLQDKLFDALVENNIHAFTQVFNKFTYEELETADPDIKILIFPATQFTVLRTNVLFCFHSYRKSS